MSLARHARVQQDGETNTSVKAFQFIEGRPKSPQQKPRDDNKENHPANQDDGVTKDVAALQQDTLQTGVKDPSSPTKPFPSTPATRLPLSDLLGNGEDKTSKTDVSPEDQITWESVRSPRSSGAKKTPAARSKKRARSSSPPSTSRRKSGRKDVIDMDVSRNTLKTPRIDPAADLWNRYAVNSDKDGLSGFAITSLANLTNPSSPYSVENQIGNVSGLRRWTSCGLEWPSSKAKRRKINHGSVLRKQVENATYEESPTDKPASSKPSTSKVTSLIERLHGSLNNSRRPTEPLTSSSSSPLHKSADVADQLHAGTPSISKGLPGEAFGGSQAARAVRGVQSQANSDSLFDGCDADVLKTEERQSTVGNNVDTVSKAASNANPSISRAVEGDDDDDFDDDLGMTADDFDVVASLCDTRQTQPEIAEPKHEVPRPPALPAPAATPDDFEEDDFDEDSFVVAEAAATQSAGMTKSKGDKQTCSNRIIQRYLVQNVYEGSYTGSNGRPCPEKIVLVEDDKTKLNKVITLRQSWFDTRCTTGSFVHVIGEFNLSQCIIDDDHNLLILHPDHLISALVVADSFTCMRRSVLQDRIKATNEANAPMVYGTMLHEIFQAAMHANRWDTDWLRSTIESVIARHIEDLYTIKLTVEQAVEHLLGKLPGLQSWAELFVKASPEPNATVSDRGKSVIMSVTKLLDVEEHVWSPMYGLKGNIDATVQVVMQDDEGERTLTVPFEVKTGKNSANPSHRAQTALYTLLLSDRYDLAIAYGILYYLETSEISRIPAIRHELRHMIMQRNELACYVRERLSLPPMVRNTHQCNRCYAKTPCFIYHKLVEGGDGQTSGLRNKFDAVVRHLTPIHQEFFKKWDDLLTKEESEIAKFKRELWTMLSEEREKYGRCFAKVVLDKDTASEESNGAKINRFRYTFRKHAEDAAYSFNESHITIGEPIVVSDEQGHYALAMGYVVQLSKWSITVAVDRKLHNARVRQPGFDAQTNQDFEGIMKVEGLPATALDSKSSPREPVVYRIDKDEFSNGLATVRNNIIQIMNNEVWHARELRSLIVDGVTPRFKPAATSYDLSGPLSQLTINDDQRQAIEKIMSAEDYALVLGMPGTGKTTTIAHIIRALVAKGKSVLLASYTHTAVDNILLKLRQDNVDVLRLGAAAKIHPEVREFVRMSSEPGTTLEEIEKLYQEPQVVATTCLGINHQIFNERTFDYCIVDEASQITLPVCLGPIRMAKTFVLVGDHFQLPPLVQNKTALEGGLDVSLFKLLCEQHPDAVATLRTQYRMNETIMSVSNELIYSGQLVCGSQSVANSTMQAPNFEALAQAHPSTASVGPASCTSHNSTSCWLNQALHTSSSPVIFINTDTVLPTSLEKTHGARITNPYEASIVTQIIQALLMIGLKASTIGLITLYRSQLALIKSMLHWSITSAQNELLEAHTADRYQGRDKDVIVLGCVRSNDRDIVGDLLKDWRRVNVALTRAKKKLIIVGSRGTLSRGDPLLAKLVKLCDEQSWMMDLPASAADEQLHTWPILSSIARKRPTIGGDTISSSTVEAQHPPPIQPSSNSTTSSIGLQRRALQPRKANAIASNVNEAFKVPKKVGKVTAGAVLGNSSANSKKSQVAVDIFREITGEPP